MSVSITEIESRPWPHPAETAVHAQPDARMDALSEAAGYALDVLNNNRGKQARLRAIQRLKAALGQADGRAS